jgi:hypothetical protein
LRERWLRCQPAPEEAIEVNSLGLTWAETARKITELKMAYRGLNPDPHIPVDVELTHFSRMGCGRDFPTEIR